MERGVRRFLGIDFGTANLRLCRASLRDSSGSWERDDVQFQLLSPGTDRAEIPAVLQEDSRQQTIIRYGADARDALNNAEDAARYRANLRAELEEAWKSGDQATVDAVLVAIDRLLGRVLDDTAVILNHYPDTANGYGAVAGVPANWPQTLNDRYINLLSHRLGENVEILVEGEAALRDTLSEFRPVPSAKPGLLLDFGMRTLEVYRFEGDGSQKAPYRLTACHAEPCGGEEFDAVFARLLAEELRLDAAALDAKTSRLLMQVARGCKEAFSLNQSGNSRGISSGTDGAFRWERMLRMGDGMCTARLQITRAKFEERAVALLDRFEETVVNGAISVGLQPRDVSRLIVVGGGTGWYFVRPRLKRCFPNVEISVIAQPEQAVVRGLARAAFQERAGVAPFFTVTTFANPLCPTFVPAETKPSVWLFPALAEPTGRATGEPPRGEDRSKPVTPSRESAPPRQGFRVLENESYKPSSSPTRTRSITIVEDTPLDTGTVPDDRGGKRHNTKNRRVH